MHDEFEAKTGGCRKCGSNLGPAREDDPANPVEADTFENFLRMYTIAYTLVAMTQMTARSQR